MSEQVEFETAVCGRLRHLMKTARMWGSPQELEAVAQHFTHSVLLSRTPGWTFDQTVSFWKQAGGPFAPEDAEHSVMRVQMWGDAEETARMQVVSGFVCVWAALGRVTEREQYLGEWIEALLDAPATAGAPDQLNMVLFALIGFVSSDAKRFVELLHMERSRIGGDSLRPFPVVAPPGPSAAAATYTRKFTWDSVTNGISAVLERLGPCSPS